MQKNVMQAGFQFELQAVCDELGLTPAQRATLARFYRRQVSAILDIAIELAADVDCDGDETKR